MGAPDVQARAARVAAVFEAWGTRRSIAVLEHQTVVYAQLRQVKSTGMSEVRYEGRLVDAFRGEGDGEKVRERLGRGGRVARVAKGMCTKRG